MSVADDFGPETAIRPPKRKPGSVPATAERPLSDDDQAIFADAPEPTRTSPVRARAVGSEKVAGGDTSTRSDNDREPSSLDQTPRQPAARDNVAPAPVKPGRTKPSKAPRAGKATAVAGGAAAVTAARTADPEAPASLAPAPSSAPSTSTPPASIRPPSDGAAPRAVAPTPRAVPQPEQERRYRQTIHRIDLWSVLKLSVCFYICGMAVTMVALVGLWLIADAAGVVHSVEKFMGDLLQTKNFSFLDGEILRGALLVSAVVVVLQIVITVIAAAFYNVFAELFGGFEITISEDETSL